MNKHRNRRIVRPAGAAAFSAVILALVASLQYAAAAEDPAVAELTQPQNTVDVGSGVVSDDSYKFGEYNGLQEQGEFLLGNVDWYGGGTYDSSSVTRWRLQGNDVGLDTGDGSFEYRQQGRFEVNLGFDDFRRNLSDSYQSLYLGAGTTDLTLPAGWLRPRVPQVNPNALNERSLSSIVGQGSAVNPSGVVVAPTPAQLSDLNAILAADAAGFRRFNLQSERTRGDLGFGANLNPYLQFTGSFRHETKDGYRSIGGVTSAVQENSVIIPDVIDFTTDQFNLAVDYARRKVFLQAGYYGSVFKNSVSAMTWQNPNNPALTAPMGSAPSNQFHQIKLTGGVNVSSATRVVADLSYGRARQNDSFLNDSSLPIGLPANSADALVVNKTANLKLTTRLTRKLGLRARYKYSDRDNQTPVNTFVFYDLNLQRAAAASPFNAALGLAPNTLGSNVNIFANRPQSKEVNEFDLGADYALGHSQKLAGGFAWEKIERACDATWISCADAPKSIERSLHGDWHAQLSDSVNASIGYAYAQRRVRYDPNAWLAFVPMANVIPGGPIVGATTSVYGYLTQTGLTGWGPHASFPAVPLTGDAAIFSPNNNIVPQSLYGSRDNVSELPGMRRFNLADRNRDKLRSSVDWQATDRLSLQGSAEFNRDDYLNSIYGLQRSDNWALGFDATYTLSDRLIASGFYTHENQRSRTAGDGFGSQTNVAFIGRDGNGEVDGSCFTTVQSRNNNGKIDPCLIWSADMHDRADTIGFSLKRNGLMAHRLDLTGDVAFTRAQTDIAVDGASYANNPFALAGAPVLPAGTPATLLIPAADLPPVSTRTFDLRLGGRYAVSKSTDLRLVYQYERTKVSDFAYDGMQLGTLATQIPTMETAPNYGVHVVVVYYKHRF